MHDFWPIIFWAIMLFWAIGGMGWWWNTPALKVDRGALWLLLAILGAYAIGAPGLPGR